MSRRAVLFLCAVAAFAQKPPDPEFEVASVKRNTSNERPWLAPPVGGRFTATNITLKLLIGVGWAPKIAGGPAWIQTDGYDVSAKTTQGATSDQDFKAMMRQLLKERFALRVHSETRDTRVYALMPAKGGLKLPDATPIPCFTGSKNPPPGVTVGCGAMSVTPESIANEKISMTWLAGVLGGLLGRPVIDRTGFTGSFKINLEFASTAPDRDVDSTKPSIFAALQDQLGLRLESEKGTEQVLVIDHVERPTEN